MNIPVDGTSTFTEIPLKVFNYLKPGFTVDQLFILANDVLGGLKGKNIPTPSDVEKAIDAINRGFDGCRVLERFSATNPGIEGIVPAPLSATKSEESVTTNYVTVQPEFAEPTITVYPNPFTTVVKFEIGMTYDSHVRLEIYNHVGALLEVILDEDLMQGDIRTVEFDATRYPRTTFLYKLTTGLTLKSGTIIRVR